MRTWHAEVLDEGERRTICSVFMPYRALLIPRSRSVGCKFTPSSHSTTHADPLVVSQSRLRCAMLSRRLAVLVVALTLFPGEVTLVESLR